MTVPAQLTSPGKVVPPGQRGQSEAGAGRWGPGEYPAGRRAGAGLGSRAGKRLPAAGQRMAATGPGGRQAGPGAVRGGLAGMTGDGEVVPCGGGGWAPGRALAGRWDPCGAPGWGDRVPAEAKPLLRQRLSRRKGQGPGPQGPSRQGPWVQATPRRAGGADPQGRTPGPRRSRTGWGGVRERECPGAHLPGRTEGGGSPRERPPSGEGPEAGSDQ